MLLEYPCIEYHKFLRQRRQIVNFTNRVSELMFFKTKYEPQVLQRLTIELFEEIYTRLILNFYNLSSLHQQVFKHMMFSQLRSTVTQICMRLEQETRIYL